MRASRPFLCGGILIRLTSDATRIHEFPFICCGASADHWAMNHALVAACVLFGLQLTASAAEPASSATSTNSLRLGSTNAPRPFVVSPELQPDRSVIFRLFAANVTNVTVGGEWGGAAKALSMET